MWRPPALQRSSAHSLKLGFNSWRGSTRHKLYEWRMEARFRRFPGGRMGRGPVPIQIIWNGASSDPLKEFRFLESGDDRPVQADAGTRRAVDSGPSPIASQPHYRMDSGRSAGPGSLRQLPRRRKVNRVRTAPSSGQQEPSRNGTETQQTDGPLRDDAPDGLSEGRRQAGLAIPYKLSEAIPFLIEPSDSASLHSQVPHSVLSLSAFRTKSPNKNALFRPGHHEAMPPGEGRPLNATNTRRSALNWSSGLGAQATRPAVTQLISGGVSSASTEPFGAGSLATDGELSSASAPRSSMVTGELWLDTLSLRNWIQRYLTGEISRSSRGSSRLGTL